VTNFLTALPTLLISIIALVGLIVLIALHDVSSATGVPIIAGLAGVHIGAQLGGTATVTPVTSNKVPTVPQ
jgi:hypothetical protein